jgi:hypothetical protein
MASPFFFQVSTMKREGQPVERFFSFAPLCLCETFDNQVKVSRKDAKAQSYATRLGFA